MTKAADWDDDVAAMAPGYQKFELAPTVDENGQRVYAGGGAVDQEGSKPLSTCDCGAHVVWVKSNKTGKNYLAEAFPKYNGGWYYVKASPHTQEHHAQNQAASAPAPGGTIWDTDPTFQAAVSGEFMKQLQSYGQALKNGGNPPEPDQAAIKAQVAHRVPYAGDHGIQFVQNPDRPPPNMLAFEGEPL
jgi:hypothetical protein